MGSRGSGFVASVAMLTLTSLSRSDLPLLPAGSPESQRQHFLPRRRGWVGVQAATSFDLSSVLCMIRKIITDDHDYSI